MFQLVCQHLLAAENSLVSGLYFSASVMKTEGRAADGSFRVKRVHRPPRLRLTQPVINHNPSVRAENSRKAVSAERKKKRLKAVCFSFLLLFKAPFSSDMCPFQQVPNQHADIPTQYWKGLEDKSLCHSGCLFIGFDMYCYLKLLSDTHTHTHTSLPNHLTTRSPLCGVMTL